MHLIIYGPEGSGKGTQAKLLSDKFHVPIYTSGDLVRTAAAKDKGLIGDAARYALAEGRYVPDSEMFVLWKNQLRTDEAKKGFILDGFPRNEKQAKFLLRKIAKHGYGIDTVIYIMLTDEESTRRLVKRSRKLYEGSTESHDTPERIAHRLAVYRDAEKQMLDFFTRDHRVLRVDGNQPVERVHEDIVAGLTKKRE